MLWGFCNTANNEILEDASVVLGSVDVSKVLVGWKQAYDFEVKDREIKVVTNLTFAPCVLPEDGPLKLVGGKGRTDKSLYVREGATLDPKEWYL